MNRIIVVVFTFLFISSGFVGKVCGQTPFYLIENKGQFHEQVEYKIQLNNGTAFLENNGITYSFYNQQQLGLIWNHQHEKDRTAAVTVDFHAVKVHFLHSNLPVKKTSGTLKTYYNYYLGKDPSTWKSKVPLHTAVYYQQVYDGIDWHLFNEKGLLKNEWILAPGANPALIKMAYEDHEGLSLVEGALIVKTSVNSWAESKPYAYQLIEGKEVEIPSEFEITGDVVSFRVGDRMDPNLPLVIDPVLVFSTYSGSRGDNFGFTATYDSKSNLYAGGIMDNESGEYPVTAGAFQKIYGGGVGTFPVNLACDITISKYDSSGSNLLFATYLGGDKDEYPHSLVVDNNDELLVLGTTNSDNFPVVKTSYDTLINGQYDIIISKFKEDGSALIGSTFLGGTRNDGLNSSGTLRYNYADDFRGDIIVDDANHVFIASTTLSTDFPLKNEFQSANRGGYDGCMAELSADLDQLLWSSYTGGDGSDALYSIKLDANYIFAGGGTNSGNLDTTSGVLGLNNHGGIDGFVLRVNKNTKSLEKLSYWGTPAYDQIYFIDLDSRNSLYVAGQTEGSHTPTAGTYGTKDKGQFVARITLDLDSIFFETTFGNRDKKPDISPSAFLVDKCNHIYLSGWGSSVRSDLNPGSTEGLEVSTNALQKTTDKNDFYIVVLDQDANSLLYATYFGGDETDDHVDGGTSRFDKRGVIYQSVCSSCPAGSEPGHNDFPVTPKAAFITNVSPRCSNASFKIDLQIKDAVIAHFKATPVFGCKPSLVTFENNSTPNKKYHWDFGDGTSDSVFQPPAHLYQNPGTYKVVLSAIDSLSCNFSDKYEIFIQVADKPSAAFDYQFDGCTDELTLTNKSDNAADFSWDMGNGISSEEKSPVVTYTNTGNYRIKLIANPKSNCPDTVFKDLFIDIDGGSALIIPNVFTPNKDGKNDCYHLQGLNPGCDEIEWYIYNRWGELVFSTNDLKGCWDGNDKLGNPYPDGAYFSVFKLKSSNSNKIETFSGTVTLIR